MNRLNRSHARARTPAPVRAVHLGLGAFHRAHQAAYTMADGEWGIAAYSFRNTELPRVLTEQDGLCSLQIRGDDGPRVDIIDSISRAHPGGDTEQWLADLATPDVALLTLTITEAAYRPPEPGADTALARVLAGLYRRYRTSGAPIALVPCDNVPDNGSALYSALHIAAREYAADFRTWLDRDVSFVSTVVDRITPATTPDDLTTTARLTGFDDRAPVVTEPFSEWLLAGDFPLGRPAWERAGACFVTDLGQYQQRKLWFLNGAHSLLAYAGSTMGCATVDEAVQHPHLAELLESWWQAAARHASLAIDELAEYRQRLVQRFAARGIQHNLLQIAAGGSQKLPARILPVLRAERHQGRLPDGAVAALAGWLVHLRTNNVRDPRAEQLQQLAHAPEAARRVLSTLDADLAEDRELIAAIETNIEWLTRST